MRFLHKIFAKTFGYFWIPCPMCGEMFGGHEKHSRHRIRIDRITSKIVCKNCEVLQELNVRAEIRMTETEKALWEMLDDIDTAGDMFKPEQSNYFKYVQKKCEERFKYITSDGYELHAQEKSE